MRKAQYALVEKWKNDTESEATVFGSAIHKALEHWYSLSQDKRELSKADAELASTFTGEVGAAQTGALESIRLFAQAAQPLRWLGDDDKRSIANGIKILKNYFKHYLNDGLEVVCDADGNPLVEKLLEAVLHEDDEVRIIFFGTIDAIMQDTISKQFVVCDHKTTAALGAQFYNRIKPNHQYTGYLWLVNENKLISTNQFLVNGIQVAKTKAEFARQATDRNEQDFIEFKQTVVSTVKQFLYAHKEGIYPMYAPNPCTNYGSCQYLDVCSAPKELRQNILETKYRKDT